MIVTKEEAQRIVWEDTEHFEMIETNTEDTSRWSTYMSGVCKHIESGKFYSLNWSVGSTEMQDESPFEYGPGEIDLHEVEQVEVMVKQWMSVKSK